MQRMIILRGVMASGKSTIAKRFRSFKNKTIWLKVDSFKVFFDNFEPEVWPFIHGAANASLEYFLSEGFSVVMEGVFQDTQYIQQVVEIVKKHEVSYKVFQLTASLKTLQERDKVREGVPEGLRPPLGDEEIGRIYNKMEKNPYREAIELNTEKLSIDMCIAFINKQFSD